MLKSILVGTSLLAASLMLGSCGEKAEKAQEPAAFVTIQGQIMQSILTNCANRV